MIILVLLRYTRPPKVAGGAQAPSTTSSAGVSSGPKVQTKFGGSGKIARFSAMQDRIVNYYRVSDSDSFFFSQMYRGFFTSATSGVEVKLKLELLIISTEVDYCLLLLRPVGGFR